LNLEYVVRKKRLELLRLGWTWWDYRYASKWKHYEDALTQARADNHKLGRGLAGHGIRIARQDASIQRQLPTKLRDSPDDLPARSDVDQHRTVLIR
jgi:hypothetical protein